MLKRIFLSILVLFIGIGAVIFVKNKTSMEDQFVYILDDSIGSWYFDKRSIEESFDEIESIKVIDVWVRHDVNKTKRPDIIDELLWHIDPEKMRYKTSDAFSYSKDGKLLDS